MEDIIELAKLVSDKAYDKGALNSSQRESIRQSIIHHLSEGGWMKGDKVEDIKEGYKQWKLIALTFRRTG
jgi:hypothetical protein